MTTSDIHNIADSNSFVDSTPSPEDRVDILLNHFTNELTYSVNEMIFANSKHYVENIAWAVNRALKSLVNMHRFLQKEHIQSDISLLSDSGSKRAIEVLRELDKELNKVLEYNDTLGCSLSSSILRLKLAPIVSTVNDCLGYINGAESVMVSTHIQSDNSFIDLEDSYKGLLEELASFGKDESPVEFIEL